MPRAKQYTGDDIEVSFDMSRCIHARNCFLKLPQVFDPARRPWVSPDAAPAEDIGAVIKSCPSGALGFSRRDGGLEERAVPINRVTLFENGPLAVQGRVEIDGAEHLRATLCRCGKSANKPYCDYAHVKAGFAATGEPASNPDQTPVTHDDKLAVTAIANGPLKLDGPMEITTGTGRGIAKTRRAFLCRCGASKTKPFCDGTHKAIGFET